MITSLSMWRSALLAAAIAGTSSTVASQQPADNLQRYVKTTFMVAMRDGVKLNTECTRRASRAGRCR
jgi:predicted acyl esterase